MQSLNTFILLIFLAAAKSATADPKSNASLRSAAESKTTAEPISSVEPVPNTDRQTEPKSKPLVELSPKTESKLIAQAKSVAEPRLKIESKPTPQGKSLILPEREPKATPKRETTTIFSDLTQSRLSRYGQPDLVKLFDPSSSSPKESLASTKQFTPFYYPPHHGYGFVPPLHFNPYGMGNIFPGALRHPQTENLFQSGWINPLMANIPIIHQTPNFFNIQEPSIYDLLRLNGLVIVPSGIHPTSFRTIQTPGNFRLIGPEEVHPSTFYGVEPLGLNRNQNIRVEPKTNLFPLHRDVPNNPGGFWLDNAADSSSQTKTPEFHLAIQPGQTGFGSQLDSKRIYLN